MPLKAFLDAWTLLLLLLLVGTCLLPRTVHIPLGFYVCVKVLMNKLIW